MFFPLIFLLFFSSSLPGLEPGQNPRCLASGPNETQVLDVSLQNNSLSDTAIVKRWICSDSERSTCHRVWAIAEGKCSALAIECPAVSLSCEISYVNEWEDHPNN